MPPSHPHLRRLLDDVHATTKAVEALRNRHTPAQLAWKPEPTRWSMLECIDHLRLTGDLYYPRLQEGLSRAERTASETPFAPSLLSRLFIWSLSPKKGFKIRTFQSVTPPLPSTNTAVIEVFLDQQQTLRALLHEADHVNLNTGRFRSPLLAAFKMTVGVGLTAMVRHAQRHTLQAEQVADHPHFPSP